MANNFNPRAIPPSQVARLISTDVMGSPPPPETKDNEAKKQPGLTLIKAICIAVIILSAATSGYFLYSWSISSRGILLSLAIAISITACQILLPELAIMMAIKKKWSAFVGAFILSIITIIATGFSMGATIGGIYDSRSVTLKTASSKTALASASLLTQLKSDQDKKARLENQLSWVQKEAADYSNEASRLMLEGLPFTAMEGKRDAARKKVDALISSIYQLDSFIAEYKGNSLTSVVVRDDFYSWTAKILKIRPESVEFIMSAFPAIFNEIVAPTMLAVVLFL
jgi:hypothetical protein